jgi:AbrB family looped-hinge helix DNA binding protein
MMTVKVSPKFQVVIPKELREKMKLRPGQELLIFERDGGIRLEPPRSIAELRGMARGIRWEESDRDHSERF